MTITAAPTLGLDVPQVRKPYKPSATLFRFHSDHTSLYRGIMGPFGSGKSVGCVHELLYRARNQRPHHGLRKTRFVAIRNTYRELESTTIKTWTDWVPQEVCPIKQTAPISGRMVSRLDDGTMMDMEILFISMDKKQDISKALGLEATGFWVNEAREVPKSAIDMLSRVGRYPSMKDGGPSWRGIIMDTNPPDTDHWWYRLSEEEQPEGWKFYRQPGGLIRTIDGRYIANPLAENIDNLVDGYGYYFQQIPGKEKAWIDAYVLGHYAYLFDGRPVYQDVYDDAVHLAKRPLGVYRGLPLLLGWDFGNTPACVVGQQTQMGVLNILREYQCTRGGIFQFVTDIVKPAIAKEFAGMQVVSVGDPSGSTGAQANIEITCFGELANLGIPTRPAKTNEFTMRREAVLYWLGRNAYGRAGFQIDPSCHILRKGFLGSYQFARVQVAGEERYKDQPVKNEYSHLQDALQYLCMEAHSPVIAQTPAREAFPQRNQRGRAR